MQRVAGDDRLLELLVLETQAHQVALGAIHLGNPARDRRAGELVRHVLHRGQGVNRDTVRDAIQTTKIDTLQGPVSFDENGDIVNKVISVFGIHHDAANPEDDVQHQYKYIGVAPESPTT